MLNQMTRTESPMYGFNELLKILDDGKSDYSSETIQRGLEMIDAPYLSLLTSATPYDLAPFMGQGEKWWHDGFWPRFAFIVPEHPPLSDRRPQGRALPPAHLVSALHNWHERLGVPSVSIEPAVDGKGKATGEWRGTHTSLSCQTLTLPRHICEAYYCYNEALLEIDTRGDISSDLGPIYSRFHTKALRVALLLASLQDSNVIDMRHWAYAQQIAEHWRTMLHMLLETTASSYKASKDANIEDRIERMLAQEGLQTLRVIQRKLNLDGTTAKRIVQGMEFTGRVQTSKGRGKGVGKSTYVFLPSDGDITQEEEQKEISKKETQETDVEDF